MAQAKRKTKQEERIASQMGHGMREGSLFLAGAVAVYLLAALITYQSTDPGWSHAHLEGEIHNIGGITGAWFADIALYLFGYLAYLFPVMVGYTGFLVFRGWSPVDGFDWTTFALRWSGFLLTLAGGTGLAALHFSSETTQLPLNSGGILGDLAGVGLISAFDFFGATLFLLVLFLVGVTLFTGLSWIQAMDVTGKWTIRLLAYLQWRLKQLVYQWTQYQHRKERDAVLQVDIEKSERREPILIAAKPKPIALSDRVMKEMQIPLFRLDEDPELPPLSLLDAPTYIDKGFSTTVLEAMSRQLELKLKDFNIEIQVVAVNPGPVITRFELQPGPGVKVSQITNLAKDIARALSVISVRVVEVIPGKSVVGLEIPNEHREVVSLSEILHSKAYDDAASPLTLCLGKSISGEPVVADLARMPHLLVAGTTGSGKSVAVNSMILSLLYKATPNEVRMIMIDPKMLELSVYEGIPHLLTPVVTDMKDAANAFRWCVVEMDRRYKLMSALGVRNITGYNRKVIDAIDREEPIPDPLFELADEVFEVTRPTLEPMPLIVVIVDELADMMMLVGKQVEVLIARLAQKARASGIHLILATQRPSVDVLTGLIKANIPTRIAFQVSSKIDSRTILDQMGAEALLGQGDMLFLPPGTAVPTRVHGAFVDDHEVHKVVNHLKSQYETDYIPEILQNRGSTEDGGEGGDTSDAEQDELYDQAVRIVTESRRASISSVQRRLKIGYNRAARMIEAMESAGIVSQPQGSGNREVLVPPPPER